MRTLFAFIALLLFGAIGVGCGGGGDDDDGDSTAEASVAEPRPTRVPRSERRAPERLTANYAPRLEPAGFVDFIDNPYFPLIPFTTFVYEGETDSGQEQVEVQVSNETRLILGIRATVVFERISLNGDLVESTANFYAQDTDGNVWYLGQEREDFSGTVVTTFGSFEAGVDGAHAGIVMLADPQVGDEYLQEYYPGVAEDYAKVLAVDANANVALGQHENCLKTEDINPFQARIVRNRFYCAGVGLVLVVTVRGGDDRIELIQIIEE
ncbi:MAG: hypothetical protein WEB00_04045 [Dehalococcoidia bacterium]